MSKKGKCILALIVFAVIMLTSYIIFVFVDRNEKKYISYARASKMLALLEADKTTVNMLEKDNNIETENGWYIKYINYMVCMGYLDGKNIKYYDAFTYGDLTNYLKKKEIDLSLIENALDIRFDNYKKKEKVTDSSFKKIYEFLVAAYGSKDGVHIEELLIAGTPSTVEGAGKWQAFTDKGSYGFEGLNIEQYTDCRIQAFVREKEILSVIMKVSDDIVYENVYLEKGRGTELITYIYGTKRKIEVGTLSSDFENCLGDVKMKNGNVTAVLLKEDVISGKVLMLDDEKVEIEGYGNLQLDENFHIYRTLGIVEEVGKENVMIGYSNTRCIVAGKKVCGAIISEALVADNIRVMVMTTGFTSLFHQRVSVKGTGDYLVRYGDVVETHKADEIVDLYPESGYLDLGRVIIEPLNEDDKITILNVEKAYGNPSYRGNIEIANYDEGLVIINDVAIEQYLYAVVPSEMPVRFGVEALKVQAVCARSYAYKQLLNSSYGRYGAHVDDSVNFQVYNNVEEKPDSIQAVKETHGQVEAYNGVPITTYYYSTSCGHTSDISVWSGNPDGAPYLKSKEVNSEGICTDLSGEEEFRNFITKVNENDYDYGFGYYRWSIDISMEDLSESINENLYGRYCANKSNILVKEGDIWVSKEIRNIGLLTDIIIVKRTTGGALSEIILKGTQAEILVKNELNIRYLLCPRNNPITLLKGDTTTFYILPSAYCIFDRTETGYHITGGGYGHGIGMSQNAVSNMVGAGMHYDEILKFFYEGSEIINVYE